MNDAETRRLERWLARILGGGSMLSAALLAAGLLLEVSGAPSALAAGFTRAGLIILLATPLLRVAASVGEYLLSRDWLFASITGAVLITLLTSLFVAMAN